MDRKEEMRRQEEDPVLLQATVQFGQGQPRILHVLDGVDEQRGTDGPITDAQAVEIVKLIDTEPRTHVTPAEGAAGNNERMAGRWAWLATWPLQTRRSAVAIRLHRGAVRADRRRLSSLCMSIREPSEQSCCAARSVVGVGSDNVGAAHPERRISEVTVTATLESDAPVVGVEPDTSRRRSSEIHDCRGRRRTRRRGPLPLDSDRPLESFSQPPPDRSGQPLVEQFLRSAGPCDVRRPPVCDQRVLRAGDLHPRRAALHLLRAVPLAVAYADPPVHPQSGRATHRTVDTVVLGGHRGLQRACCCGGYACWSEARWPWGGRKRPPTACWSPRSWVDRSWSIWPPALGCTRRTSPGAWP